MIIKEINLDDFDRKEYLALLQTLIDYYYVCFNEGLILKKEGE